MLAGLRKQSYALLLPRISLMGSFFTKKRSIIIKLLFYISLEFVVQYQYLLRIFGVDALQLITCKVCDCQNDSINQKMTGSWVALIDMKM